MSDFEEGPPHYLLDMRLVYSGMPPRTVAQEKLRALFDEDLDAFLARWAAAEKEYRASRRGGGEVGSNPGQSPVAEDPGTDRAVELIDRLLSEHQ